MTAYIGQVIMFAGNFAPVGWAFCNGQLLSIAENEALFQLIGTTYGGDGQNTFGLPDLRGRVPVGVSANRPLGTMVGTEARALANNQLPLHTHRVPVSTSAATRASPEGGRMAVTQAKSYGLPGTTVALTASASEGQGQSFSNMAPALAVNFIISLFGIFPSPS
jgi:microcystin-dependent protein